MTGLQVAPTAPQPMAAESSAGVAESFHRRVGVSRAIRRRGGTGTGAADPFPVVVAPALTRSVILATPRPRALVQRRSAPTVRRRWIDLPLTWLSARCAVGAPCRQRRISRSLGRPRRRVAGRLCGLVAARRRRVRVEETAEGLIDVV